MSLTVIHTPRETVLWGDVMMLPRRDSTKYQEVFLEKIRKYLDSSCSDDVLLMNIFHNYRKGTGLRIREDAFKACTENKLYEFVPYTLQSRNEISMICTQLDRICDTPYYVDSYRPIVYISDEMMNTHLILCHNNFKHAFEIYG
jgi:hypothetical protein